MNSLNGTRWLLSCRNSIYFLKTSDIMPNEIRTDEGLDFIESEGFCYLESSDLSVLVAISCKYGMIITNHNSYRLQLRKETIQVKSDLERLKQNYLAMKQYNRLNKD